MKIYYDKKGIAVKKKVLFLLHIFVSGMLFAATAKDAEERIQTIESFKSSILHSQENRLFSDEEFEALNLLYEVLESDEYTVSSLDGGMNFSVGNYSLVETKWPVEISGLFFGKKYLYERSVDLLYSTVLEKKYVAEQDMTEYQRRDYEYYVNEYENRLRSGETVFYAELTFKITHWNNPSEYRFDPLSLKIYKIARRPREILFIDETDFKDFFQFSDEPEFRTEKQIGQNSARIRQLLKNEAKDASSEKAGKKKKQSEQKGRRAFYISTDTEREHFGFSDVQFSTFTLDNVYGNLTFGLGKFLFAGISIGFDLGSINRNSVYSFGGLFGANLNLGSYLRPYASTGISARTDDKVVFKAGAGLDITFGHFMINIGYDYNWSNSLDASKNENTRYSTYSAGIGLTW